MLALSLLLAVAPQNPIVLPPPTKPAARPHAAEANRSFEQDVLALRRSALRSGNEDAVLADLAARYPDFAARAAGLTRTADPDLLHGLLRALERFGTAEEGKQLEAVAISRPLGDVAGVLVQTMAHLQGDGAKDGLFRCLQARAAGTRRVVAEQLRPRLDSADAPRLLELASRGNSEIKLLVWQLLGATPTPEARLSLRAALGGGDLTHAIAACDALVAHGPALATDLQQVLGRAASDRSFGFAAVALTRLELGHGRPLLAEESVPHLRREVEGHDPFMRVCAAIALAQLAFRSTAADGTRYGDPAIVDGLMLVAAPGTFVPAYSLLQPVATEQLRRFTNKSFATPIEWANWWTAARDGFVGMRRAVDLDLSQAGLAVVLFRTEGRAVRLRGEQSPAPAQPLADEESYLVPAAELARLVQRLQNVGFMSEALAQQRRKLPAGVARPRVLEVRLGGVRASDEAPARADEWMDRFAAEVEQVVLGERWQLYHDPAQGDFATFWRNEQAWFVANADRTARATRLKDLIVASFARLQGLPRQRALQHLNEITDLEKLLTEADGFKIVAAVSKASALDADGERLLALALRAESDKVWREALVVIDQHLEQGGRAALPRLFRALGDQRVLQCLADPRPHVRVAAIREIANLADLTAVPALLLAARDSDPEVQQAAITSLGTLRAPQARQQLLDAIPSLTPAVRRAAWLALGRIGGDGVFAVLLQATTMEPEDKRVAIQALGKLDDPQACQYLASLFVAAGQGAVGNLALLALQDQGALRARGALREALRQVRDKQVRADLVLVLGDFQDPAVVPDLIELLGDTKLGGRAAFQLGAATGVDLSNIVDRAAVMREWWLRNRDKPQAQWFLNAVAATGLKTNLSATQLEPRAGVDAVPELTRILTSVDRPHVRLLTLALLRDTTQRDFGNVSADMQPEELLALADRYRIYAEGVGRKQ